MALEGSVFGCTDPSATNYNRSATSDDGSCIPEPQGWGFGTTDLNVTGGGTRTLDYDKILAAKNEAELINLLGLPQGEEYGFSLIDQDILKGMEFSNPEYGKMIRGTQQAFKPTMQSAALALGSGREGGLLRGERSRELGQSLLYGDYMTALRGTYRDIGDQRAGYANLASSYLGDLLTNVTDLDFSGDIPTGESYAGTSEIPGMLPDQPSVNPCFANPGCCDDNLNWDMDKCGDPSYNPYPIDDPSTDDTWN